MKILVINAGSSSLKYQLMESEGGQVFAKGLCERIGIDGRLTHKVPGRDDVKLDIAMPSHGEAIQSVLDILDRKNITCVACISGDAISLFLC